MGAPAAEPPGGPSNPGHSRGQGGGALSNACPGLGWTRLKLQLHQGIWGLCVPVV